MFTFKEAKFAAFSSVSFHSICVGMRNSLGVKWLRFNITATSLRNLFKDREFVATNLGRSTWKRLMPDSSLQRNCRNEGFNVRHSGGRIYARIGIIANQENDCASPDSFIGFGTIYQQLCSPSLNRISCGNYAACSPDNGDKSVPAMGYILVQ